MKQKKLIFNFFVNRNWKKLTDSRKRAKILAHNRKTRHPIETILNFRHFNTNSKKFFERVNFSRKKQKRLQKGKYYFAWYIKEFSAILRQLRIISIDFRRLPTIPEYCRRFPKNNEEVRLLPKMSEEPSKHLTVVSLETVNIKKLANLTANARNYGQITLDAKPHSDGPS